MKINRDRFEVIREAMAMFVENQRDYVESEDNVPHTEKVKLDLAIEILDEMNEAFLTSLGVT